MFGHLSDVEWLLLILLVIYLAECTCWLSRSAVCFTSWRRGHRPLRSPSFLGNDDKGLVITNPLPWSSSFVCEPWPIAVAPGGISLPGGPENATSADRFPPGSYLPMDAIRKVVTSDRDLRINGMLVCRLASPGHAQHLAQVLRELAAAAPPDRQRLLENRLHELADTEASRARLAESLTAVRRLRRRTLALFFWVFGLGSAIYYSQMDYWDVNLAYFFILLMLVLLTLLAYAASRRAVLNEPWGKRWRHTAMLLLSPASAMRSAEGLLRPVLAAYHPVTAAIVLCPKTVCADLARPMLCDLRHPLPGDLPRDPAACRIDAWYRQHLLAVLEAALCRAEIDPTGLIEPPKQLDDGVAYCPRCHNQYVRAEGICSNCPGVRLQPYEAAGSSVVGHDLGNTVIAEK